MGQLSDKLKNMSLSDERVPYEEASNNGLIMGDKYIPEELLFEIFYHVDHKTLCKCQLVCKRWYELIQSYIWRKKAEMTLGRALPIDENAPWSMYYFICDRKPFSKNLIKNHSGSKGLIKEWSIIFDGGQGWKVENPPVGVPPLPEESVFEGKNHCFVTSYQKCLKQQVINLLNEGFTEYLLDNLQPTIKVSEWFSARWDCPAVYICTIELIQIKEDSNNEIVLDSYNFSKVIENEDQNQWFKFEHEFKNYGKRLRKIKFSHGGQDRSFWAGHYGSKMAGACIKLEIPEFHQNINSVESN